MPLTQNVSGTLKKITKLTQNVSGTLKPLTSLKQNVSGTLKEILAEATFVAPTLTWTASNNQCKVSSQTNNGKNVSAAIYNGTASTAVSNSGRIYSNTFYIPAGNVINITYSASCSAASTAKALGIYLVSSEGTAHTIVGSSILDGTVSFEVPSSDNYYFVITGFGMTVTGSASGAVTTTYYSMNITAAIAFNADSGGTATASVDLLTVYPTLAAPLSGIAYGASSGSADTNSATISVNTSNYKYLKVSIQTTSYINTTCSLIIVFNTALLDNPVVEIDLTGAATTHTKTITLSSSSIANKTLTSCTMALYFKNGATAAIPISATPTEFKFYN
jgi:hypothetical protein